jgi:hypothetical protein
MDKHPFVGLMDCGALANMDVGEQKLRDTEIFARSQGGIFMGMFYGYKAQTQKAMKISNNIPFVILPGASMDPEAMGKDFADRDE